MSSEKKNTNFDDFSKTQNKTSLTIIEALLMSGGHRTFTNNKNEDSKGISH
jgi:hypothetical protein